ncbi:hypothetical protein L345_06394, partial [Ophiophagus hannah]
MIRVSFVFLYILEILQTPVPVISYQSNSPDSALQFLCEDGNPEKPRFNHLIAIERAGMAADGNYYNARKVNIKHLVDPIDELFIAAQTLPGITTTGIGDGGNELGMGKVKEATKKHIKNGDVIACDVEADFAVVAGVANWGGYAVACGLYILNTCEIHDRYVRKAIGYPRFSKYKNWASALPSVAKNTDLELRVSVTNMPVNHTINDVAFPDGTKHAEDTTAASCSQWSNCKFGNGSRWSAIL